MNMILCGDFAQLPPVRAKALYSPDAIWHQFTTVVILRENMRQWLQTREDITFRAALENMRYKDCTSDDINLLHSLCSKGSPGKRKLEQARFRHQRVLWNLPPDMTDHKAGKLSLRLGMPVLIKKNIATECCVTNGAEAIVVGWQLNEVNIGNLTVPLADVLFVEAPTNVVPLTRSLTTIEFQLPNCSTNSISREQNDVLPNFAMTDYASQGRTRPNNVINLTGCNSHYSYYTCFSCSCTVQGTVVIKGFNPEVVQGGSPGWMRQEEETYTLRYKVQKEMNC
ncbi:hypothetical protein K439DRAFT_1650058 [Ramaria rubella]|nr:hypothetical protein K439DRAFT_1650058 [Ramaria rubella]